MVYFYSGVDTIRDWFAKRPRWQVHFTPTSASWLNQVERWFGLLTDKQIRRGVHRSTKELERTILDYIDTTNQNPKPFKWTKSADDHPRRHPALLPPNNRNR